MKHPNVGDAVVFHDDHGVARNALITCYHGPPKDEAGEYIGEVSCVNLVFVSGEEPRQDQYGRQMEHRSSIPHKGYQGVTFGNYWRWSDEEPIPYRAPSAT